MNKLFKGSFEKRKERGILSLYVLNSLNKKPKSGYEIINEIKEKTSKEWVPSKGSIYPLLKHLEEKELIIVKKVEQRSKKIYKLTNKGKKLLIKIKNSKFDDDFFVFKKLIFEIFNKKKKVDILIFEIVSEIKKINKKQHKEIEKILTKTLKDIKKTRK